MKVKTVRKKNGNTGKTQLLAQLNLQLGIHTLKHLNLDWTILAMEDFFFFIEGMHWHVTFPRDNPSQHDWVAKDLLRDWI